MKKLHNEPKGDTNLEKWKAFLFDYKNPIEKVKIGLVGKYVQLHDAYKSIAESFVHAGVVSKAKVEVKWIQSDDLNESNVEKAFEGLDGILVAPGFGNRGIEGKLAAIKFARENNIPFFGICLGMQCAVIEFAQNVLGLKDATSAEFDEKSKNKVIDLMEEQKDITQMGGTMRLGSYPCELKDGTLAYSIYQSKLVNERHRHRYEFNDKYLAAFEKAGMIASGINPKSGLVEIVEIPEHPFFIGSQFHPELKSTVLNPQPIFVAFIKAALKHQHKQEK